MLFAIGIGDLAIQKDIRNKGRFIVGLTDFSKVVRTRADLWQIAKTTLQGLDLLTET